MPKRQAHVSGNGSIDSSPPFFPLEETARSSSRTDIESSSLGDISIEFFEDDDSDYSVTKMSNKRNVSRKDEENNNAIFKAVSPHLSIWRKIKLPRMKQVATVIVGFFFAIILWECFFVEPEDRLIKPEFSDRFLTWVQSNPTLGLGAILVVIAAAVVSLIPIGTPLTLGCGYIYRGVYGWKMGLFVSTLVSMTGSTLGAVTCFLLGRYLMRDTVKRWVRNYPMFDAIDVAVSEQGVKIMAMLYLTPVLPLGLVSYMCGTTAMNLHSFVVAKIASLPLYLMYTFMGASAHSFIKGGKGGNSNLGKSLAEEANKLEENQYLILSGLILSAVMIGLITRKIKKELMKILDEQKKEKIDESSTPLVDNEEIDEKTIELGLTARRKTSTKAPQK
mmetsp:Transcript_19373/g.39861  ORF Transcript_19373/g.39861 Transcript_19373/m.39861 type:complete len:390 (-) Transcript_19373:172-1341(-)